MRKQRTIERVIAGFGRALRWLGLTILPVMVVTLSGSSRALGYAPVCDALGRLAERRTSGDTVTTNRMDYAGWQLIAEYNQAGTFVRKYVYGDGLDEPVRMTAGTRRYYYHPDGLGSVATITTNSGLKAESYTYDVYGTPTMYNGAGSIITSSAMTNRLLFTAPDRDVTTQLYNYRHRYYSPTVGRFLQPDPINLAGGDLNLYRYVGNNPVNLMDPLGLWGAAESYEYWMDTAVGGQDQGGIRGNLQTGGASLMMAFIDFWGARDVELSAELYGRYSASPECQGDAWKQAGKTLAVIGIAAVAGGRGGSDAGRHRQLLKRIVQSATKPGVMLSDSKIAQLERVVTKAGGTVRTEIGKTGSVRGVLHSHVEGLGSRVESRHIIHATQP